ncbi:MAG: hypothetical protein IT371_16030 [Deltaproteobacteria bacterium]|nr:hypothetical protein [Deltaproteobacteria bacterium]
MTRRIAVTAIVVVVGAMAASTARAQKKLVVGMYLPTLAGVGRAERIEAVEKLAAHLAETTGRSFSGRSFASDKDLYAAAAKKAVHFAVVGAQTLSEQAKGWVAFASLSRRGATTGAWQILAKAPIKSVNELAGKSVVLARVGRFDKEFVTNVLLDGEVAPSYFEWLKVPDTASAIQALKLGKAQGTVLPEGGSAEGFAAIFSSKPVPLPVMVNVAKVAAPIQAQVLQALLTWPGNFIGYSGWMRIKEGGVGSVRAQLMTGRPRRKPSPVAPKPFRLAARRVLADYQADVKLPSALGLFRKPYLKPDQVE